MLISLKFPVGQLWTAGDTFTAEVWAINDTLDPYQNCRLQINLDDRLIHSQPLDLPPNSARPAGRLTHQLAAPPQTLSLSLSLEATLLCQNSYNLAWSDPTRGRLSQRLRRWVAEWVMR